jgi:outer membrane biosynthesis protein TonB
MKICRQFVIVFVGVLLLATAGCEKKKPQLPQQAMAPAEPIPTPLPAEITEATPPPPAPAAPPQETPKPEEPKPQPAKHHKRKPSQPPTQTSETNPQPSANTTIAAARPPANPANEAPPDTAIAADVSSAQLVQQKQTTAQLLDATEKTLNGLPHDLSHDEVEMVAQIRSYLAQSRKATTDGDFERAYNLATKAHLLSDALVKK